MDSMRRPSRRLLPVVLLLALLLLVGVPEAAAAAGASGGMTREQHMQAKRAFDRAKHHPSVNGDPEDADDRIEYTAADGTTKTMSRAELEARLRQQQEEGPPLVGPDGSLTKQREGKATLEELREKDPFLARVVDAGKYALSRLQVEGEVGQGARLKSLHSIDEEEGEEDQSMEEDPQGLHLRLVVAGDGGDGERTFEVRLAGNYLAEALEVTSGKKQTIPLSLRPPASDTAATAGSSSSSSPWQLLRAYSPVPPTLLLMSAGVAVLLMGVTLVALGGLGKGGSGKAD